MSRNQHFHLYGRMGTSYAPSAETSAEGDVLYGLREDDASLRLGQVQDYGFSAEVGPIPPEQRVSGLREDDASLRLGRAVAGEQGAEGVAEGSAEGGRVQQLGVSAYDQLGVSAYDVQPAMLSSDGRVGGLREDDASLRLGVSAYDEMAGLREDDANLRISGLREDDASLRLGRAVEGGEGAEGVAEGSAEGTRVQQMGVSAYDRPEMGVSAYDRPEMGVSAYDEMRGLREDDANLRISGLREDDASVRLGVSAYDEMKGLREDDASVVIRAMRGLREDDASLRLGEFRTAMILRGLADTNEALDEMGRRRAFGARAHARRRRRILRGLGVSAYDEPMMGTSPEYEGALREEATKHAGLGAEDFHPRFPVQLEVAGFGQIDMELTEPEMDGFMGFVLAQAGTAEYLARLIQLRTAWQPVRKDLLALPAQSRAAIVAQMEKMEATVDRYDRATTTYIAEGAAGMTSSRVARLGRLETSLPTIRKLIDQAKAFGPAPTPAEEQRRTDTAAKKDVDDRLKDLQPTFVEKAAPYAAVVGGGTAVVLTALAIGGVI